MSRLIAMVIMCSTTVASAQSYRFIDLGPNFLPAHLEDNLVMSGTLYVDGQAHAGYGPHGNIIALAPGRAHSHTGHVVVGTGFYGDDPEFYTEQATRWDNGVPTLIPMTDPDSIGSEAIAISYTGWITGAEWDDITYYPLSWRLPPSGSRQFLLEWEPDDYVGVRGINANGYVAGSIRRWRVSSGHLDDR
jgi:hypothetical protein